MPEEVVLEESSPFSRLGSSGINADGLIAFWSALDDGGSGIFSSIEPVIEVGDMLCGSSVTRLNLNDFGEELGNLALNDPGQIVFHFELSDGRQGIVVASPIPEPTAAGLLVSAFWYFCIRRSKTSRRS